MSSVLFGLNVPASAAAGTDPVADALAAEAHGFDFVSVNDHPFGTAPMHECWTLLATMAARTTTLRVAPRVLALPYRHPTIVAKMAASLAVLSGGRLILGFGGGARDDAVAAAGLPAATPREKVDRMEEAVRVLRALWTEPATTFDGAHFRTEALTIEPKPPAIPVWLGTFGPRALRATGRVADGWIPSLDMAPPEAIPALRARIAEGATESGRDLDEIRFVYNLQVLVGERDDDPSVVSGSAGEVVDRLASFVRLGFRGFNLLPLGARDDQVERLASEVLPALRG